MTKPPKAGIINLAVQTTAFQTISRNTQDAIDALRAKIIGIFKRKFLLSVL